MNTLVGTLTRTYEDSGLYRLDHLRLVTGSENINTQYAYDGNSVRVDSVTIDIGEDSSYEHRIYYEYDELGNIEIIHYFEGIIEIRRYEYTYDELNRLSIEKVYSNDNTCAQESDTCYSNLYQYDERGNVLAILKYEYADVPTVTSEPSYLFSQDLDYPVIVYWNGVYQPNDIYYLQLNETPYYDFDFIDPSTGLPYADITCTDDGGNLNITQTGFYYRTFHATSPSGVDATFNIVFFVGEYYEAKTYNYSSEWLDQLESYAIMDSTSTVTHGYTEYDEQGNPLEATNFSFRSTTYDHADFIWNGRQLVEISIRNADDSVAATIAYQYNDQGYRISKIITVGTTVETYTYDLIGSTVHRETYVKKVGGVTQDLYEIRYLIDSDGNITGFVYEDDTYYYLKDIQGNILSIINESGTELVQYEYDAFGNVINNPDDPYGDIFEINPYTYRGYRFDSETSWYYLNSRFYSPIIGRFLNSDGLLGQMGDTQSTNMYAYCGNNPVNFIDPFGNIAEALALLMYGPLINQILGYLITFLAGIPVWGWIAIAVIIVGTLITIGIMYAKNQAVVAAQSLIYAASVSPAPLPPNKGGKGTKVNSKTYYDKNGFRLDVENPTGSDGSIHVHYGTGKYSYDIANRVFKDAPNIVQGLLNNKDFLIALGKALKLLGFGV